MLLQLNIVDEALRYNNGLNRKFVQVFERGNKIQELLAGGQGLGRRRIEMMIGRCVSVAGTCALGVSCIAFENLLWRGSFEEFSTLNNFNRAGFIGTYENWTILKQ